MESNHTQFWPPECNLGWNETNIEPDADIIGVGVVVSFCVSAWLLWIAFLAAWWYDALPECFDDRLLWLQIRLARGEQIPNNYRSQRQRVFTAVTTALSDQQLVLGSSVLIAALVRFNSIDTPSINIVVDLAFLAGSAHCVAMTLMEFSRSKHRLLKIIRTTVMGCNYVMLAYLMVMQQAWQVEGHDWYLSLSCTAKRFTEVGWSRRDTYSLLSFAVVFIGLTLGYEAAIMSIWDGNVGDPGIFIGVPSRMVQAEQDMRDAQRLLYQKEAKEVSDRLISNTAGRIARVRASESYAFISARGAVEWDLIAFSFPLFYGTFSIIRDRYAFETSDDVNAMGFGQIAPLILLLLPMLAALQASADYHDEIMREEDLTSSDVNSPPTSPTPPTYTANITQPPAANNIPQRSQRTANTEPLGNSMLIPRSKPTMDYQMTSRPQRPTRDSRRPRRVLTTTSFTSPLRTPQVEKWTVFWLSYGVVVTPIFGSLNVGFDYYIGSLPLFWTILFIPSAILEIRFFVRSVRRRLYFRKLDLSMSRNKLN